MYCLHVEQFFRFCIRPGQTLGRAVGLKPLVEDMYESNVQVRSQRFRLWSCCLGPWFKKIDAKNVIKTCAVWQSPSRRQAAEPLLLPLFLWEEKVWKDGGQRKELGVEGEVFVSRPWCVTSIQYTAQGFFSYFPPFTHSILSSSAFFFRVTSFLLSSSSS